MLTNQIIERLIKYEIDLSPHEKIMIKTLWYHLFHKGYRPKLIRFLETPAVRFPETSPYLTDELLQNVLGSSQDDLGNTELKIEKFNLVQAGTDHEEVETKGKYILEVLGIYFIRERQAWSDKTTKLFTMTLSD